MLHLPEIGRVFVAGMTQAELESFLNQKFSAVLTKPDIEVQIRTGGRHDPLIPAINFCQGRIRLDRSRGLAVGKTDRAAEGAFLRHFQQH